MDDDPVRGDEGFELRRLRQTLKQRLFGRAEESLRLGRFVILERLGEGGMGVVFAGYDPTLDRKVAIKVLRGLPGEQGERQRLRTLREAQALARLSHPGVIAVFEVGELDGAVFIVMEFIRGVTFKAWLAEATRTRAEVLAVLLAAGRGLAAAHRAGLVHRDFKPENVMVGEDGGVRVVDFGLARLAAPGVDDGLAETLPDSPPAIDARLTRTGVKAGTPGYMAPEQWAGAQPDARSDQYSYCAVVHEALLGVRPHGGDTLAALHRPEAHVPAATTATRPGLPAWLHAAIVRGLAPAPEDRFPALTDLLDLIARDPEAVSRRRRQRAAQIAAAIAATALLVIALVLGSAALERRASEQRAEARRISLRSEAEILRRRGDAAGADHLLRTFVELPEHRGAPAIARAYLDRAADEPDPTAAIDALASAYISARTPDDEQAALTGLIRRLADRGSIGEAAAALAVLARDAPAAAADPSLVDVRVAAALHRRDLPGARDALAGDPALARWAPVLEDLSRTTLVARERFGGPAGAVPDLRAADLDGDGRVEISAVVLDAPDSRVRVVRAEPAFTLLHTLAPGRLFAQLPLPFAAGGEPLMLADHAEARSRDGGELRLQRIAGDASQPPLRWYDSRRFTAVAADLDADGRTEVYVGTGAYERRLWRLDRADDGTWSKRPAHPPIDDAYSDLNALAAGDLDGDGRPELIVAAGAWHAYDLRILRTGADGQLEQVTRRAFGTIPSLVLVRSELGPAIALRKTDDVAPGRFPPDRPRGDPAGLYLVGLRGGSLEVLDFVPEPPATAGAPPPEAALRLFAGDLDGDGFDEVVTAGPDAALTLLRWRPGQPSRPLVVAGLTPGLVLDVDGDERAEILATPGDDPANLLLLGAGDRPLPPLARPGPEPRPVPRDLADPALAVAWARGEQLVALGLLRRPADELAALAGLSGQVASDMLLRTGELYTALGDNARAAQQFEAAAARPDLAAAALAGAAAARRRRGEFAAAADRTAELRALPGLPAESRAAADLELAALRRATAPRPELLVEFTRPLRSGWRISDPLAVQRDLGRRELSLWSSPAGVTAELPLAWDGGPVALELEFVVDRIDWSVDLMIGVAAVDAARPWIGARVGALGTFTGAEPRLELFDDPGQEPPRTPIRAGTPVRARIEVYPELDATITSIEVDGVTLAREVRPSGRSSESIAAGPGEVRLRLGSTVPQPGLVGHLWIRRVRLTGFTEIADPPEPADAALQIADGALVPALAALQDPSPGSLAQLWRAEVLARLGRVDEAREAIRGLAGLAGDAPPFRALHDRLRRGPGDLTVAARDGLGERWLDVWTTPFWDTLRTVDLVEAVDGLEIPVGPYPDPESLRRAIEGLYLHGRGLAHAGRYAAAEAAYAAGLALTDDPRAPPGDFHRPLFLRARLTMAADMADRAAVVRRIDELLALHSDRELELELLRADPRIAGLLTADDWVACASAPRD